jgi:hypothetical protein
MTILPIVDRELRVRSRNPWTYRARMLAALAAVAVVGLLLLGSEIFSRPASFGKGMFVTLAWGAFLFCLLEGARNTADCLSEEKRAGTLGLLFLTDLKGYDVVLGKVMATSVNSCYGLLAIFPPLGIPLVMGGVTAGEFWRLTLVLIGTLAFSLSAGVLVSAFSREARSSWWVTFLLVAGYALLPPLWNALPLGVDVPIGPVCALAGLFDGAYQANAGGYWTAVGSLAAGSLLLVTGASLALPRTWQDGAFRARGRGRVFGARVQPTRRPLLDGNPVAWLVSGGSRPRFGPWLALLLLCLPGLLVWSQFTSSKVVMAVLIMILKLLHVGLSIWVASEACALMAGARDSGMLEQLFCTPLSTGEVVNGFRSGLRRIFLRPLLLLLAMQGVVLGVGFSTGLLPTHEGLGLWLALSVGASVTDTFAVARFGLWAGLSSPRHGVALGRTLGFVLLGPMFLGSLCFPLWGVLTLVKNLIFMSYADGQLRRRCRTLIAERYDAGGAAAGTASGPFG